MALWWVRHGPTGQKGMCGWSDPPADLSDREALARLHRALPAGALLVSSDLLRARATADALGEGRRRLPDMAGLREFNFGRWEGLRFEEIAERDPERSRRFWEVPGETAAPGGESWDDLSARITAAEEQLCAAHPGAEIVLVAHFGVILTRIARALDQPPARALALTIPPLSLTRIEGARVAPLGLCP